MSTNRPAMEKTSKAKEAPVFGIKQEGSMNFAYNTKDGSSERRATAHIVVDIGSSCVKGSGSLLLGTRSVSVNYPSSGIVPTQFLRVNIKKMPSHKMVSGAAGANYVALQRKDFSVSFSKIPTNAKDAALGVRMAKVTMCQPALASDSSWRGLYNNEVIVKHKPTAATYKYINLGTVGQAATGDSPHSTTAPILVAWNLIASKKIATPVAAILADLAREMAAVCGIDAVKDAFAGGIELFVVNAMPNGTPVFSYNDELLTEDIRRELKLFWFLSTPIDGDVVAKAEETDGAFQGKFFVRYAACSEMLFGLKTAVLELRGRDRKCAAIDMGHSTCQLSVIAITGSGRNERISMEKSTTKIYSGMRFADQALERYCEKMKLKKSDILWSKNTDLLAAANNYTLLDGFVCGEDVAYQESHFQVAKDGVVQMIKVDKPELRAAMDFVGTEMVTTLIGDLTDAGFFVGRGDRVLSVTGRLSMYRFKTGAFSEMNVAAALESEIRVRTGKLGYELSARNVLRIGTMSHLTDVARTAASMLTETPTNTIFAGPVYPLAYGTVVVAERTYEKSRKGEDVYRLANSTVCALECGGSFELALAANAEKDKDIPGATDIVVCVPVCTGDVSESDVRQYYRKYMKNGGDAHNEDERVGVLFPFFRFYLPENAASKITIKFAVLGTFEMKAWFTYADASGAFITTEERLLRLPPPSVESVHAKMYTTDRIAVSLIDYMVARTSAGDDSASAIIENALSYLVDMPSARSVNTYSADSEIENCEIDEINNVAAAVVMHIGNARRSVVVPIITRSEKTVVVAEPRCPRRTMEGPKTKRKRESEEGELPIADEKVPIGDSTRGLGAGKKPKKTTPSPTADEKVPIGDSTRGLGAGKKPGKTMPPPTGYNVKYESSSSSSDDSDDSDMEDEEAPGKMHCGEAIKMQKAKKKAEAKKAEAKKARAKKARAKKAEGKKAKAKKAEPKAKTKEETKMEARANAEAKAREKAKAKEKKAEEQEEMPATANGYEDKEERVEKSWKGRGKRRKFEEPTRPTASETSRFGGKCPSGFTSSSSTNEVPASIPMITLRNSQVSGALDVVTDSYFPDELQEDTFQESCSTTVLPASSATIEGVMLQGATIESAMLAEGSMEENADDPASVWRKENRDASGQLQDMVTGNLHIYK